MKNNKTPLKKIRNYTKKSLLKDPFQEARINLSEKFIRTAKHAKNKAFTEVRKYKALDDYIALKLISIKNLEKMQRKKPLAFQALQLDHVAAALGVVVTKEDPILSKEERITIEDLENLKDDKINRIIYECKSSDEVIEEIRTRQYKIV